MLVMAYGTYLYFQSKKADEKLGKEILNEQPDVVQLPEGIPVYPNAKAEAVSRAFQSYHFSTADAPANVLNYYVAYFRNVNSQYQVTPERTKPRGGTTITSEFIDKITITNPHNPDHKFIAEVSVYREGDKTVLVFQFPVGN